MVLDSILGIVDKLKDLYEKSKVGFIMALSVLLYIGIWNKDLALSYLGFKENKLEVYLSKSIQIKRVCESLRLEFNSESVTAWIIHNGSTSLNRIHLMKADEIAKSQRSSIIKQRYVDMPLYPYATYIHRTMEEGYFYVYDIKEHKDPSIRNIYRKTKLKSIIYFPIWQGHELIGYITIGYKEKHFFTEHEISEMCSMNKLVEAYFQN